MKNSVKDVSSAVAKALIASVLLHVAQKYVLKGVDAVEDRVTARRRKKKRVGFYK